MSVEVNHNSLVLPFRQRVLVRHVKTADRRVADYCNARYDRGFRIRCIPEHDTGILELGTRNPGMLIAIIRELKESGMLVKKLPWQTNALLRNS